MHALVGYLALIIASVHRGLHWTMLTAFMRSRFGIESTSMLTIIVLRRAAALVAIYGVHSLVALNVGSKILMQPTMEFWDFETATPAFFGHLMGIIGFFAAISHVAVSALRNRQVSHEASAPHVPKLAANGGLSAQYPCFDRHLWAETYALAS